jgi:hypothetical protein
VNFYDGVFKMSLALHTRRYRMSRRRSGAGGDNDGLAIFEGSDEEVKDVHDRIRGDTTKIRQEWFEKGRGKKTDDEREYISRSKM